MLKVLTVVFLLGLAHTGFAQKVDSIFFNLYTDSLKRGTYNYINVEGKLDNGTYLPLGSKELKFTSSAGTFSGNSLFIDSSVKAEKITIKAALLADRRMVKEIDIYIKKHESNERLPTMEEVLNGRKPDSRARKPKKKK